MSDKRDNQRIALISVLLALLTLGIFWQVWRCDFVNLDDDLYVTQNTAIQHGLTGETLKWAFESTRASNWHPLTWISHALDCQFYGLRPAGHHLTNLLFHVVNAVLLFIWLWRLTGALWRGALVAALFAWHPLHVESVAWVAERKDVLSTFFLMLTLLAYQKFKVQNAKSKTWYSLALTFFVVGLLAKPMLVTLPFVLLLVDFWSAETRAPLPISKLPWKKWLSEKIPFFALAATSSVVTFLVQQKGGAVNSFENLPLNTRLANAAVAYFRYLCKTFWPDNLAVFYPQTSWASWQVAGAGIVLLAITFLAIKQLQQRPYLATGWFWFLGTLVPVIGLIQVGAQSMADRYAYVPLIGLFIVIAWGLAEFASHLGKAVVAIPCLALTACGALTWQQTAYWLDSESLFKHSLAVTGDNVVACSNLGAFLVAHDRPGEAFRYFEKALLLAPNLADTQSNLGFVLVKTGKADEGIPHLQRALELDPNLADAHFGLGTALIQQNKTSEAIAQFRDAARLRPGWSSAHESLSAALAGQGDLKEAVDEIAIAAQIDPANPDLQNKFASLLTQQHDLPNALNHYREAVRLYREVLRAKPDFPPALNNLAWLLASSPHAEIRNGSEAVALAQHACELTGWKYATFVGTLAAAQAEASQFDAAVKTAARARELALAAGDAQTAAINEKLSRLYQSGKAFHEDH